MVKKVHYPVEIKWEAVNMKLKGFTNKEIMDKLGIKNKTQIKTWMKWYRTEQTERFEQPVGKQYSYGKGIHENLSEIESLRLRNKQLEMSIDILKKYQEIERRLAKK